MMKNFSMYDIAVNEVIQRLQAAGFKELKEADSWDVKPKDKVVQSRRKIAFFHINDYFPIHMNQTTKFRLD